MPTIFFMGRSKREKRAVRDIHKRMKARSIDYHYKKYGLKRSINKKKGNKDAIPVSRMDREAAVTCYPERKKT